MRHINARLADKEASGLDEYLRTQPAAVNAHEPCHLVAEPCKIDGSVALGVGDTDTGAHIDKSELLAQCVLHTAGKLKHFGVVAGYERSVELLRAGVDMDACNLNMLHGLPFGKLFEHRVLIDAELVCRADCTVKAEVRVYANADLGNDAVAGGKSLYALDLVDAVGDYNAVGKRSVDIVHALAGCRVIDIVLA